MAGNGQDELLSALSGEELVSHSMLAVQCTAIGENVTSFRISIVLLSEPE